MHRQHPDAQPGLGVRAWLRLILRGKPLQGPLCLWRAQRDGDHSTSQYILTLVMFPRFGVGGSCEHLAGRRYALAGPQGTAKQRPWFWIGARSEALESREF